MNGRYLVVGSVTYAMKGKETLLQNGIRAEAEKLRRVKVLGGCGYALLVDGRQISDAMRILALRGIRVYDVVDR